MNDEPIAKNEELLNQLFRLPEASSAQADAQFVKAVMADIQRGNKTRHIALAISIVACAIIILFQLVPLLESFSLALSSSLTNGLSSELSTVASKPVMYLLISVTAGLLFSAITDLTQN